MKPLLFITILLYTSFCTQAQNMPALCRAGVKYEDLLKDERFVICRVTMTNKQAQDRINEALAPDGFTGLTTEELVAGGGNTEDEEADNIIRITAEVLKNDDCLLSVHIQVTAEARILSASDGAYPITDYYRNFDLATGNVLNIDSLIRPEKRNKLLRLLNKKLHRNFCKAKRKNRSAYNTNAYGPYTFIDADLANFYLTGNGLYFHYDFHFMHCDEPIEPERELHVGHRKLRKLLVEKWKVLL